MSKANTHFGTSIGVAIVVAVLVVIVNSVIGSVLKGSSNADMSDEAVAQRIAPVGKLNTGEAIIPEAPAVEQVAAPAGGSRSGKEIYDASCFACHATGAAGAPKLGDTAAWAPRIEKGMDTLMNHAINGFNAMPPRGTCGNCSDDDLKLAVEYMIDNSK